MAISLAGIDLPDLVPDAEYSQYGARSIVEFSLGGQPIIWEDLRYGQYFDLVAGTENGWIERSVIEQVAELADIPQSSYTLVYEGDIKIVRFRNEDPPAIEATPILPRPNQEDTDYYNNVRIKLMVLG